MRLLAFFLLLPGLAFGQGITTLNNGDPADANTVNANFQNLDSRIQAIEDAGGGGGGCSVEQVDNSAEITCADGSTAVIAGAGSVLVLPEGVQGEALDVSTIPTGDFYWEDGNGVAIGYYIRDWSTTGTEGVLATFVSESQSFRPIQMVAYKNDAMMFLRLVAYPVELFHVEPDCQGATLIQVSGGPNWVLHLDQEFYVRSDTYLGGPTLIRSKRLSDGYDVSSDAYSPSQCENQDASPRDDLYFMAPYQPPAEWLNAAYPLTLKQYPK